MNINPTLYVLGQIIIVLLTGLLLYSIYIGLNYAFQKLRIRKFKREELLKLYMTSLVLWLAILATLSFIGFFQDFQSIPPPVIVAFIPPVALIIGLLFSRLFRFILIVIPFSWLIYIQAFRILMELFLWLGYFGNYVPRQMTFEWLNFDIMAGISALMAGYVFFGNGRYRRSEAILWNVFGIVLLINIVFIAIVSTPSPFQIFHTRITNTFIANFPFIWIPGFIVPFALAMHIYSLKQLYMTKEINRRFRLKRRNN